MTDELERQTEEMNDESYNSQYRLECAKRVIKIQQVEIERLRNVLGKWADIRPALSHTEYSKQGDRSYVMDLLDETEDLLPEGNGP